MAWRTPFRAGPFSGADLKFSLCRSVVARKSHGNRKEIIAIITTMIITTSVPIRHPIIQILNNDNNNKGVNLRSRYSFLKISKFKKLINFHGRNNRRESFIFKLLSVRANIIFSFLHVDTTVGITFFL